MPTPEVHDPAKDRAAGALLGVGVAADLVGAPPPLERSGPSRHVADLVLRALHDLGAGPDLADPPPQRTELSWAQALRHLVRTATPPDSVPELERGENACGASWRALRHTPPPHQDMERGTFACTHLMEAIRSAATTTNAAALHTGALAGALWGASALPTRALRQLSRTSDPHELLTRALIAAHGSHPDHWPQAPIRTRPEQRLAPFVVPHPLDEHVLLGNLDFLRTKPEVDAVVSLCRVHPHDAPDLPGTDWVRVWLHDRPGANTNVHFTLQEAADAVGTFRAEGKRVLVHCWAGASRTPAVAARYAATTLNAPVLPTLRELIVLVGGHLDNPELARTVAALSGLDLPSDPVPFLFPEGLPPRRTDLPSSHISG